jgi:sRNA-binding regulator protein Hfq
MSNPSPVVAPGIGRSLRSKDRVQVSNESVDASKVSSVSATGPRKLIRPSLSARSLPSQPLGSRNIVRRSALTSPNRAVLESAALQTKASHAENFYLQKQAQEQTLMVIVLEDGEQIEGFIEWYDLNTIKVRHSSRTLVYKSSIKYLYKAGEGIRI